MNLLPVSAGPVQEEPRLNAWGVGDWLVYEPKKWKELIWCISYYSPSRQSLSFNFLLQVHFNIRSWYLCITDV